MILNVAPTTLADELIPIRPTEITAGFFPQRITIVTIETEEERIQAHFNGLRPPYLQRIVHQYGKGRVWI